MQKTTELNTGIYILELFAENDFSISAKKFTDVDFPKGYYYYIGSAQKNLNSRIERHLQKNKKIHWHIDHLTTHKSITVVKTYILPDAKKNIEAELANGFVKNFNAEIIVKGFGNSDTKETITHLFYSAVKISAKKLSNINTGN